MHEIFIFWPSLSPWQECQNLVDYFSCFDDFISDCCRLLNGSGGLYISELLISSPFALNSLLVDFFDGSVFGINFSLSAGAYFHEDLSALFDIFDVLVELFIDIETSLLGLFSPFCTVAITIESDSLSFFSQFFDDFVEG